MTSESGVGPDPDHRSDQSGASAPAGVAGRADIALTLQQQPTDDVRGAFGRVFGADPLVPAARGAFDRATGARRVGRLLDGLGPDWVVVHAVALGGRSADAGHVAVGPPGALVVTSAHHRIKNVFVAGDEIFVDRQKTTLVAVAKDAAERADRLLRAATGVGAPVTPVIVFVDPKRVVVREKPKRTRVFADLFLRRKIRRLPTILTGDDLARLQAAAVSHDTWPAPTTPITAEQVDRFDEIERSATTARRLRNFWRWTSAVVVLSAVLLVVQGFALGILG